MPAVPLPVRVRVGVTWGWAVSSRYAWSALAMGSAGTRGAYRSRAAGDPSQWGQRATRQEQRALQVVVAWAAAIALVVRTNTVELRVAWHRRARVRGAAPRPARRLAGIYPRLAAVYPRAAASAAPRARSAPLVQLRFSAVAGDADRRPRRADQCRFELLGQVDGVERQRPPCRRSRRVAGWLRCGGRRRWRCIAGRSRSRERGNRGESGGRSGRRWNGRSAGGGNGGYRRSKRRVGLPTQSAYDRRRLFQLGPLLLLGRPSSLTMPNARCLRWYWTLVRNASSGGVFSSSCRLPGVAECSVFGSSNVHLWLGAERGSSMHLRPGRRAGVLRSTPDHFWRRLPVDRAERRRSLRASKWDSLRFGSLHDP